MLIWGQCDWGRPSKNIHVRLLIAFDSFSTEHLLCIGYFKILSKLLIPLYTSDLGWFHVRTSTYLIDRLTSIFLVRIDKSSKHKTWIISNCSLIIYLSSATSIGHLNLILWWIHQSSHTNFVMYSGKLMSMLPSQILGANSYVYDIHWGSVCEDSWWNCIKASM